MLILNPIRFEIMQEFRKFKTTLSKSITKQKEIITGTYLIYITQIQSLYGMSLILSQMNLDLEMIYLKLSQSLMQVLRLTFIFEKHSITSSLRLV